MAVTVTTSVKTNTRVLKALQKMQSMSVLVGIPDSGDGRAATYPGGLTSNATIGYLQETGNPSTNLPARPHLVPGVKDALPRIERYAEIAIRQYTAGDTQALRRSLDVFGLMAVASVKRRIQANIPPPLAMRTRMNRLYRLTSYQGASKKRKAAMRARWATARMTALIDTGAYINSITYVVR